MFSVLSDLVCVVRVENVRELVCVVCVCACVVLCVCAAVFVCVLCVARVCVLVLCVCSSV